MYASGYLIVSIYHSQFGFVGTNPFRPKVLAAGAWFFFFTSIPVSVAMSFRSDSWLKIGRNAAGAWIACYFISAPLGTLLFDSTPLFSLSPIHMAWWLWVVLAGAWVLLVVATTPEYSKVPMWVATVGSVLLTVLYAVDPVRRLFFKNEFNTSSLTLWFFAVFVAASFEFKRRFAFGEWAKSMAALFGALLIFSQYFYPHLKASWGGGMPANVTVYFSKDSLLNPNKAVQAQLIEEADEGFYIVGSKESKAIFVPRSSVAMIYFSDKPSDSPMLQNIK